MTDFDTRLTRAARRVGAAVCVGIDPTPAACALLGPVAGAVPGARATRAAAIERLGGYLVEAARDRAIAVKPQLAWFEQAGADGLLALERVVTYARRAGLLVVLDAKRGDVPHTAGGYAEAWLGEEAASGICGDALTVNAWLGPDALAAFAEVAHAREAQVYALVLTSNPGAEAWIGMQTEAGDPWWHHVARAVSGAGCGAVIGATHPGQLEQARELLPTAPLLVPGVGAQGGSIDDLVALATAAAPPPLVASSRGLLPTEPVAAAGFTEHVRARVAEAADAYANALGTRLFDAAPVR